MTLFSSFPTLAVTFLWVDKFRRNRRAFDIGREDVAEIRGEARTHSVSYRLAEWCFDGVHETYVLVGMNRVHG